MENAEIKKISRNYLKHATKNAIAKALISNFYRELNVMVKGVKGENILDVGCGEGFTIYYLKKKNKRKFVGIDISSNAISMAKKINPEHKFYVQDATKTGFKDESFSIVLCNEVLEHLNKSNKGQKF